MRRTTISLVTVGALAIVGGCAVILGGEAGTLDESVRADASPDAPRVDDGATDAGCVADLSSDKMNCGRCGLDCLGGDCVDGQCTPVTIAANLPSPYYLAQDATHLYVSSVFTGHVHRVAKDGKSSPERIIDMPTGRSFAVVVDDTYLYASDIVRKVVMRVPKTGGAVEELAAGVFVPDLEVENGTLYMTIYVASDGGLGSFERMQTDGGARTTIAGSLDLCEGLALAPDKFYVGVHGDLYIYPRAGGSPTVIVNGYIRKLLYADDGFLYWTGNKSRGVSRVSKIGMVERYVDAGQTTDEGCVAVDDRYVYWSLAGPDGHVVYFVSKDPSTKDPPHVLLTGGRPVGVVLDERSIYVADMDGVILRVSR